MEGLIESGSFDLQDWAWVEGQTEWMPLARVQQMLLAEEAAKVTAIHQRVEQTKGQWRSKMTTPLPSYRNAYSPIRTSSPAACSSPVREKKAGGSGEEVTLGTVVDILQLNNEHLISLTEALTSVEDNPVVTQIQKLR